VRIAHGHSQRLVAQDFLQGQDVSTVHHEATGERVAQNVGGLTSRQDQLCSVQGLVEAVEAFRDGAVQFEVPVDALFEERVDWDRANALALGLCEGKQPTPLVPFDIPQRRRGMTFYLPASDFRCSAKKAVILSKGILSRRSYRSTWLAPGTITSSLGSAAAA